MPTMRQRRMLKDYATRKDKGLPDSSMDQLDEIFQAAVVVILTVIAVPLLVIAGWLLWGISKGYFDFFAVTLKGWVS